MDSDDILLCHFCGKIFYKLTTLESHTKWKHSEKSDTFMCDQCGKIFLKKFNLIKHMASGVHEITETVNCALCDFRSLTRKIMCGHYKNFHGVIMNENNAYFSTPEEFFLWKVQYEQRTKTKFVKMSSSRLRKNGYLRSTYFCHRDGNFIPKGRHLRLLKTKGSNKINAHCPAKIDVEMGENLVIVSYVETHLGHDLDIARVNLDHEEKVNIAEKLASQVPFEQILDELNKTRNSDGKRINFVTRKDLWNIVETFKIDPKSVVYSNNRRKRRLLNHSTTVPVKKVKFQVRNVALNQLKKDENNSRITIDEEGQFIGQEIMSSNDNEEVLLCPIILRDENDEDTQHYVVVSNESVVGDDHTCLIVNANGELETLSGNKVIYTEDGGIQITANELNTCDGIPIKIEEDKEQIFENSYMKVDHGSEEICEDAFIKTEQSSSEQIYNYDMQVYNSDEVEICVDNGFEMLEDNLVEICERDEIEICKSNTDLKGDTCKPSVVQPQEKTSKTPKILKSTGTLSDNYKETFERNIKISTGNQFVYNVSNNDTMKPKLETDGSLQMINGGTSVPHMEPSIIEMREDHETKFEVIVQDEFDEQENKYVIMSDMSECEFITSDKCSQDSADLADMYIKHEEEPSTSHETSINSYLDEDTYEEYCGVVEGGEPAWSRKRTEILHKLINVHSLINDERQLQVFSNNISSLENVLKSMSKSNETIKCSNVNTNR